MEREEELEIGPENLETVRKAYKSVFGRDGDLRYDEHYPDVVEIDGIVAIAFGRAKVEKETPSGKVAHNDKRWFVEGIKWYPATRWEPEDVDYFEVSDHERLEDAVSSAFGFITQRATDDFFDNLAYEWEAKMREQEKEEVWT